jgi:hypothetical protein
MGTTHRPTWTDETPPSAQSSTGFVLTSGSGEIRTHGTLSRTHTFQACALNHSATDPDCAALCRHLSQARWRREPPNQRADGYHKIEQRTG